MSKQSSGDGWRGCPWTLALIAVMGVANAGLLANQWAPARAVIDCLQFDRHAILHGELWRLVTANLVHWSIEHFLLDAGAFLVVGCLYERYFGRGYPWMLLACGLAVGCGVFAMAPELATYRGLSGVDSGQFAAALCVEAGLARRERIRWLWLAPVAALFGAKILWEIGTGRMFFGT
jgi:rhomboid family GlyGly-CTERM serine protease